MLGESCETIILITGSISEDWFFLNSSTR